MGAKSSLALKSVQWFIRGVQLLCAAVVLGIFSYFLAALHNHDLQIDTSIRAVEGISGAAVLYTLVGLLFLCCVAGLAFTSFIAIVLDFCFIGCFIYVAVVNKHGAGSCSGYVDTPFGAGQSGKKASGSDGFTALPSFHTACRLQTACMAVSIIAIFFFIFSMLMEVVLVRNHRKEKRFGPGPQNNYTSGSGSKGGFFGRFRRNKNAEVDESNHLPQHTHPDQLDHDRQSYGTEHTAVNHDGRGPSADYQKQEVGYGYQPGATTTPAQTGWHTAPQTNPTPANYRYGDGVYERA
ncbi:hypothetical protein QQS21_011330 [Conoideocrella luteorostrata]|uniref:MARVEL domain-containing protein n=1 Tax=Conoideocrella luteorostrata TaxID=1105319 RepID=A0AAJ0CDJ0_9HYPO|nr:hypothetical protein QQS21_011330 [Conoideocrella luteorostrata]